MRDMKQSTKSLVALTVVCTLAAIVFGFGSEVFSFKSTYQGTGQTPIIMLTRLIFYLALAVILAFKGGWPGVLAAIVMVAAATTVEWLLFPFSYGWASLGDPSGYAKKFGEIVRPSYARWGGAYDIIGVGATAAFARILKMMAYMDPKGPRED